MVITPMTDERNEQFQYVWTISAMHKLWRKFHQYVDEVLTHRQDGVFGFEEPQLILCRDGSGHVTALRVSLVNGDESSEVRILSFPNFVDGTRLLQKEITTFHTRQAELEAAIAHEARKQRRLQEIREQDDRERERAESNHPASTTPTIMTYIPDNSR